MGASRHVAAHSQCNAMLCAANARLRTRGMLELQLADIL
jgi:hypothetical protein